MKRYNTPLLGSHYGATIRLLGPHVPEPVLHPLAELEPIRNPFLPPEGTLPSQLRPTQRPAGALQRLQDRTQLLAGRQLQGRTQRLEPAFDCTRLLPERESDAWSNDMPSRLLPKVPASGRMVFGSFLIFAVLGAGGFAALYSAVHSDDAEIRVQNAAEESLEARGAAVPKAAPAIPLPPLEPTAALIPSSGSNAQTEPSKSAAAASRVDSGAQTAGAVAAMPGVPRHAVTGAATPFPARLEAAPAPKVVVHVEPAPVVPAYLSASHRVTHESDGPVSEDALLGSAHPAPPAPPPADSNGTARPAESNSVPSSVANSQNPDGPSK